MTYSLGITCTHECVHFITDCEMTYRPVTHWVFWIAGGVFLVVSDGEVLLETCRFEERLYPNGIPAFSFLGRRLTAVLLVAVYPDPLTVRANVRTLRLPADKCSLRLTRSRKRLP